MSEQSGRSPIPFFNREWWLVKRNRRNAEKIGGATLLSLLGIRLVAEGLSYVEDKGLEASSNDVANSISNRLMNNQPVKAEVLLNGMVVFKSWNGKGESRGFDKAFLLGTNDVTLADALDADLQLDPSRLVGSYVGVRPDPNSPRIIVRQFGPGDWYNSAALALSAEDRPDPKLVKASFIAPSIVVAPANDPLISGESGPVHLLALDEDGKKLLDPVTKTEIHPASEVHMLQKSP